MFGWFKIWRKNACGRLVELLHYSPPKCDPATETVERMDCGDHLREKVWYNTTPHVRAPAYVLFPKQGPKPAPAIVALHDHGGYYLWGKEKIVAMPGENPDLTSFSAPVLRRPRHRERAAGSRLCRRRHRHVLLGRASNALGR